MTVRRWPPRVAGQFYPADSSRLRETVDRFVSAAPPPALSDAPAAIVAPHAGYVYSGRIAGIAYGSVRNREFRTIVVIAPSHREAFRGVSVYGGDAYCTPLGDVPVDEEARSRLAEAAPEIITIGDAGHREEHAVEVQVPFVQRVCPAASLLPIAMHDRPPDLCERLGHALAELQRQWPLLLVASSDLYHGPSAEECEHTDQRTLDAIRSGDPMRFLAGIARGEFQACGAGPIATVLYAARARGEVGVDLLTHGTSAEVTGSDSGYVVGYAAMTIGGTGSAPEATGETISDAELLAGARRVISDRLEGRSRQWDVGEPESEGGVFVTLRLHGRLRGCIGLTRRHTDLVSAVREAAEGAAFRDPRFPPLAADELDETEIEISLLTPLRKLETVSPEQIRVGRDGLQIELRGQRGLLLPQVAVEAGWDERRFLEETCRKAGLPRDAWKDPTAVVSVFGARKFGEGA